MVERLIGNQKNLFWEALVITFFIFGVGVLLGVFIEDNRIDKLSDMYFISELNLLDVKIQTELLNLEDLNCEVAVRKNIEFADRVYEDAKVLERYEGASRIKDSIVQHHKRYDLLRTLLWLNSIKIKEKCPEVPFHTVVYLYDYQTEDIEQKNKQIIFSRFLEELKSKHGDDIILIPLAKNLEVSSLELMIENYVINQTSIIVDEKLIITELEDLPGIEKNFNVSSSIIQLN